MMVFNQNQYQLGLCTQEVWNEIVPKQPLGEIFMTTLSNWNPVPTHPSFPPVTEFPRHTPGAHQWDATHYEVRRIHSCPGEPWPCKWFGTLLVVGFFVGITKCGAWTVGISTNGSLVRTGLMVEPVLGRSPAPYKLNFWGLGAQTKDIMIDCGISGVIVSVYLSTYFLYLQYRPTSLSIHVIYLPYVCIINV